MNILLLNAGSSSLKCTLMDSARGEVLARGLADWAGFETRYQFSCSRGTQRNEVVVWKGHGESMRQFVFDLMRDDGPAFRDRAALAAIGHRVVHGGQFSSSVRITPDVRSRIMSLAGLAPLHNPPSLETLAAAEMELPNVPQVAVFDTAFHATIPPEARTYAIPQSWTREWGIQRFGFHGLSHAYCASRAAEMLDRPLQQLRLVICHLGHGCSASAVRNGNCVETTMGFTPLEGLMMATRSGSLDPSIVLHVQQHHGLTPQQVDTALNRESGLLGVSGISADMRQVLAAAKTGHEPSRLAIAMYVHRVRQAIGALTVSMGGIDALILTAGVGENSDEIRERVCASLVCLDLELNPQANATCRPDADIATTTSRGRILVIATREDVTMLREVVRVLSQV
jgi:acetate kinase